VTENWGSKTKSEKRAGGRKIKKDVEKRKGACVGLAPVVSLSTGSVFAMLYEH
jgi:hypothetical protein